MDQKGVFFFFHKTPASFFYLIDPFSSPNPLSLKILITVFWIVIDFIEGNGQNQSLGTPFCGIKLQPFSCFFSLFFCLNLVSLHSLCLCMSV